MAVDLADIRPYEALSRREQRAAQAEIDAQRPGFFQAIHDAASSEWVSAWALRQGARAGFQFDPDWTLDDAQLKDLTQGIPEDYWGEFTGAISRMHADRIREQLLGVAETRKRLASLGIRGIALRIGANIFDPAAIAVMAATAGVAGEAVYGVKLNRLQRLVRGGLVAAGTEGTLEAYLSSVDPDRDVNDILWAAGGAFAIGGGLNVVAGRKLRRAARSLQKEIEYSEMTAAGLTPTDKGRAYFLSQQSPEEKLKIVQALTEHIDLPDDELARLRKMNPDEAIDLLTNRPLRNPAVAEFEGTIPKPVKTPGPEQVRLKQQLAKLGRFSEEEIDANLSLVDAVADKLVADGKIAKADDLYANLSATSAEPIEITEKVLHQARKGAIDFDGTQAVIHAMEGADSSTLAHELGHFFRRVGSKYYAEDMIAVEKWAGVEGGVWTRAAEEKWARGFERWLRTGEAPTPELTDTFQRFKVWLTAIYQRIAGGELDVSLSSETKDMFKKLLGEGAEPPQRIVKQRGDLDFSNVETPTGATKGPVRYDMVARLKEDKTPSIKRYGHLIAEDPFPDPSGAPNIMSASEWKTHKVKLYQAEFYREYLPTFNDWAKANNVGRMKMFGARAHFGEEVGKAVRYPRGAYTSDPHINKAANLIRGQKADMHGLGQRYGVKGFKDIPTSDTYLMRIHNLAKIDKAIATFGLPAVERLIRNALIPFSENLTDELAEKLAKGYLRNVRRLDRMTDIQKARMFSGEQSELLRRILKEELPDIADDQIEDIIYGVKARDKDGNLISRAKRRLALDETYRMDVTDETGKVIGNLGIEDLLENNAEILMELYTHQIVGASAMAEVYRGMAKSADDVIENFDSLLQRVKREAEGLGESPRHVAKQMERLEVLGRSVLGLRLHPAKSYSDTLRSLRGFQYLRVMNQVGFAQIAEAGMAISEGGFSELMQQLPALRRIYSRAANGKMSDELLEEIEGIWSVGTDRLRGQVTHRFEASGYNEFVGGAVDQTLRRGQRFVNDVSLMAPINMALQRTAAICGVQKWGRIAMSGRPLSKKRLASMALSPEDGQRIMAAMRDPVNGVIMEQGTFGRRVRRINIENWADQEAASKFIFAMDKWSRRVIQENDIGSLATWMTTDIGRTVIQFRTFVTVAWEKQFLHNIYMHDIRTFTNWAYTMVFGGLAYIALQHINGIGRPDRDEFLKERLSPGAIGRAAWMRAGWSSLMPGAVDSAAYIGGFEQPFRYGRTTQLDVDFLFGNPTMDWVSSLSRGGRGLVAPTVQGGDYQFSQADYRAITKLLPFQNMFGVQNMLRAMGGNLPEESKE